MFLAWLLADGISEPVRLKRMCRLKVILTDLLSTLPATSVGIERQHANIQLDTTAKKVPPRAGSVQANSYATTAYLAHEQILQALEKQAFGDSQVRIKRALRSRLVHSGAPLMGLGRDRSKLNVDGTVKRRGGLLKGMLWVSQVLRARYLMQRGR